MHGKTPSHRECRKPLSSRVMHSALQVRLQARRFQRLHQTPESPLEGLPFDGCSQATHSAEICPPARGGLRVINHWLVRGVEHQPVQQLFGLLLSAPQAASNCLGLFLGQRVHCNHIAISRINALRLTSVTTLLQGAGAAGGATGTAAALAAEAAAAAPAFWASSSARLRCSSSR